MYSAEEEPRNESVPFNNLYLWILIEVQMLNYFTEDSHREQLPQWRQGRSNGATSAAPHAKALSIQRKLRLLKLESGERETDPTHWTLGGKEEPFGKNSKLQDPGFLPPITKKPVEWRYPPTWSQQPTHKSSAPWQFDVFNWRHRVWFVFTWLIALDA